MNCPCGNTEMIEITEDVDIGVGIQHHLLGWECPKCGSQFGLCYECGAADFMEHHKWCVHYKKGE